VIATGAGRDHVTLAQSVLTDDLRRNVGISLLGEIAVGRASNEPAVARRVEPAERFAIRDDGRRRRLLLMIALSAPSAVPAIATAVPVELLLLWTPAVVTARLALVARVTMLAVLPMGGTLCLLALPVRPGLRCVAALGGCLRCRCGRSGGGVVGGDGGHRWWGAFTVVVVARVRWSVWARVAVRVRLARLGGIATIRARPTAATVRASAFGHATLFVMGCLLALTRRDLPAS